MTAPAALRPYQEAARAAVHAEWEAGRARTLLVMPTGTGKTVVFAKVVEDVVRAGGRALVLAHRGELLDQAATRLMEATGLGVSVEKAGRSSAGEWFRVVVGSVQSMSREPRLAAFDPGWFDLVVIDEAHHAPAAGYQAVLSRFGAARVLGVTATADRADRKSLGACFDSIAYEYTMAEAIRDGWLCPIEAQTVPLRLDLGGVGLSAGDFKASDLGGAIDPFLGAIADEMVAAGCLDRRTVVFLPLVRTSLRFAELLGERGFSAAEIDGASADRAGTLARFAAGELGVLCNAMLLTEGWDRPEVDCIVVLRPTRSRGLYAQMVGRGTRPYPGKRALLLLDFLWLSDRHALCHPADLLGPGADVSARMTAAIAEAGGPVGLEAALAAAEADALSAREAALARELAEMRSRQRRLVDPVQYAYSIQAADLAAYEPSFNWELLPPTKSQLAALERLGIFPDEVPSSGYASMLLDRLAARRQAGLSTPRQIRYLEGRGFTHVGTWSFKDASAMVGRISKAGWRLPRGVDPATYEPAREEGV